MLRRMLAVMLPIALGAFILAACDSGTGPSGRLAGKTALTVQLTDAPGALAEAWVKIDKIVLLPDSGAPVTMVPDTGWLDLLTLTGGETEDLLTDTIPAGKFNQVRLYVCEMYVVTDSGGVIASPGAVLPDGVEASTSERLHLASECHSGFKVNIPKDTLQLASGAQQTLVLDFDAARSFVHQAGKSGQWIVTPVLNGSLKAGASNISGTVTVPQAFTFLKCGGDSLTAAKLLPQFVPTATNGDSVRAGLTTAAGIYKISNVLPGTWTMGVKPIGFANGDSLLFTAAATPPTVTLTPGVSAVSNYAVSAAACKVKA